jgi:predicted O-methyltransferase YrrM
LKEAIETLARNRDDLAATDLDHVLAITGDSRVRRELENLKKSLSMLHTDVLMLLYALASVVDSGILEFGPYVGGSTIAIARGLQRSGRRLPFVSVEVGGRHDHETLPSLDILADLRRNLEQHGVSDLNRIVVGRSNEEHVLTEIRRTFADLGVGLWMIDADGLVGRDFTNYLSLCRPRCLLVIDDYISFGGPEKIDGTRTAIHEAVSAGRLRPIGVYGWGTWIGQVP